MYYPDEVIEEVRSSNNIVDIIGGYVRLQKKGSSYFGLCPFHNEKSPSFSVSPNKQMYYCFGCGAGGNVFTFIMEYENQTFPEAVKILADRAGIALPEAELTEEQKRERNKRQLLLEINKTAANYFYYQLNGDQGQHGGEEDALGGECRLAFILLAEDGCYSADRHSEADDQDFFQHGEVACPQLDRQQGQDRDD